MNIELHIEELVLRGFDVHNRMNVAETIQRELVRLLSEGGLPAEWAESVAIRHVQAEFTVAPGFRVSPAGGDKTLANQVAQSTYGALGR